MKPSLLSVLVLALAAVLLSTAGKSSNGTDSSPQFTSDGKLLYPKDYREWVFLSSGLGMTYGPAANAHDPEHPLFDNVFVARPAYESFLKEGTWPDKTIFVLEVRSSDSK